MDSEGEGRQSEREWAGGVRGDEGRGCAGRGVKGWATDPRAAGPSVDFGIIVTAVQPRILMPALPTMCCRSISISHNVGP